MFKRKLPVKTAFFLLVSLFVLSLVKDLPESNAFLKDRDSKRALTAAGDLKVSLVDESAVGNLTISANHSRDIFVKNEGEIGIFVRVLFHPTLENAAGYQRKLARDVIVPTVTADWVNGKDGYYYYKKKLAAKSETDQPVFDKFVAMTELEATEKLTFYFKVEAITAKGVTYRDAWWEGSQPSGTNRPELVSLDGLLKNLSD